MHRWNRSGGMPLGKDGGTSEQGSAVVRGDPADLS
jgi:hypothetical protein